MGGEQGPGALMLWRKPAHVNKNAQKDKEWLARLRPSRDGTQPGRTSRRSSVDATFGLAICLGELRGVPEHPVAYRIKRVGRLRGMWLQCRTCRAGSKRSEF